VLKVSGTSYRPLVCVFCLVLSLNLCAQDANQEEIRISSLLAKVEDENRTVDELIANNLTNLPVGIKKKISNTKIIIAIDSAVLTPEGMFINAYTQVTLPGTTKPISLAARNILITPAGISLTASSRLVVISEFIIPISDQVKLILPADGSNYIEWDCNGFRSVNLRGLLEFSSDYFIPDPILSSNKKNVTASFEVNTTDFNNILISTSIDPFKIKGLGDMTFVVRQASIDMSDFVNCEGFMVPAGYQNTFSEAPQLWRGFFLKELNVLLPAEISGSSERKSISAYNLLIDESGISGYFSATNVLPINMGDASGWPFSVDRIDIGIAQNKLTGGSIGGAIGVPFLGSDTLGYFAQIESTNSGLQYNFSVMTNSTKNFNMPFGGTVMLDKGCRFEMKAGNGKFIPSAILNGTISIQNDLVNLEKLRFEGLRLSAESPYISGGTFSSIASAGIKLSGFEVGVNNISLSFLSGRASLGFDVKLALMNKDNKGISANTRFFVNASIEANPNVSGSLNSQQKWRYDGTLVQKVFIKGSVSLFYINGGIDLLKDDPVYGNGFHGQVGLMINKILKDTAKVEIYFGTKVNYKYWFAKIDIPTNIPIGTVTLSKLVGGAYSNMEQKDLYTEKPVYVPTENTGLGFLAGVGLYVKDKKLFSADALFEITFNPNNGVKYISFTGNGQFFSGDEKKGTDASVSASINMVFDNENDVFHANLKVYMNIANAIKGIGPNGLLGESIIHCDTKDWYIYIGRPSSPLGVNVLGMLESQSYFMAGTKVENMPLPPSEVAAIIQNIDMDFMKSENGVATGRGVAFGIRLKASAGFGENEGFVYAYFNAGAGADILLKNYGTVQCAGRSGPIGIDGWYASGQGYAYLTGKIGVRVKSSKFDIMSVAAALLLQAKLPNPTWFQGNIAARYSILGGLVKGKVNIGVTLGEECVLVTNGNVLDGIKLIGDIKPAGSSADVDVFAAPQVSFNTNIDKEFGMVNVTDQYEVYRVRLDQFNLITSDNQTITGTVQWNSSQDLATLKLKNILPGKQKITTSVKVHVEKKSKSGYWEVLTNNSELGESSFVTGEEPKSIPENNVIFSYPIKNQYNFYRNEYPRGYIKLGIGQPNLFRSESEGNRWDFIARFKNNNGSVVEAPVAYNDEETMVYFDIPKTLGTSLAYELTIVKKPVSAGAVDRNLQRSEISLTTANSADSLSLAKNQLTGSISAETETSLHSFSFRTSTYSTFTDKLNSISNWKAQYGVDFTRISIIGIKITLNETFDKYEIEGKGNSFNPLISVEALRGVPWIDSHVNPQVYELYGSIPDIMLNRNTNILGVLPLKAMSVYNSGEKGYLFDGSQSSPKQGDVVISYDLGHYVYTDFCDLRNKAAAKYLGNANLPTQAYRLLSGYINDLSRGNYPSKINYSLPGLNIITTTKELNINY
jgi:hypothetical protein